MEPRIFHGDLSPDQLARALIAQFNRGNLRAHQLGSGDKVVVQIASSAQPASGGQTALTISLNKVADGLAVQIGQQAWWGVAASLGQTALSAWRNPWSLLGRLDDLAQDVEYLQLSEQVWKTIEAQARASGVSYELSERLRRMECAYCGTGNPVGEGRCLACGAPLGALQPRTCMKCGFVVKTAERRCPNCGNGL